MHQNKGGMEINPEVSIIIATYNCSEYLSFTIDSALTQTYPNFEIIIVNDGSTDETDAIVAKYGSDVIYMKQENRGPGAARNAGLRVSKGDYLLFLDADDLLLPDMLEMIVGYLETHPRVDIAYCDGYFYEYRKDDWVVGKTFSEAGFLDMKLGDAEQSLPILLSHNAFPPLAAITRKCKILEVGGFDEDRDLMVFADWDLWYRLAETCCFEYINQKLVLYRILNSSISHDHKKLAASCLAIEGKIKKTSGFLSAETQDKSRFYIELGKLVLSAGDRHTALGYFRQALQYNPYLLRTWVAYLTTYLIGQNGLQLSHYL